MASTLTVIMPVYNEEESIEAAVGEVRKLVLERVPGSELLAVDDGSRDNSPALLDRLAQAIPGVRVLHKPNGGHGDALRYGLDRAEGEYLFLIDSDRQIPIEDFGLLWEKRAPRRLVSGIRTNRQDPLHRLVLTRFVRAGIGLLFGKYIRDANIPFKLLHRSVWERAEQVIDPGVLTPSLFLAVVAAKDPSLEFVPVKVRHRPRTTGVTVLKPVKLAKFCGRALGEMLAFRRKLKGMLRNSGR
jgi:glycosyltransferase involved in cell wall biosynthesis